MTKPRTQVARFSVPYWLSYSSLYRTGLGAVPRTVLTPVPFPIPYWLVPYMSLGIPFLVSPASSSRTLEWQTQLQIYMAHNDRESVHSTVLLPGTTRSTRGTRPFFKRTSPARTSTDTTRGRARAFRIRRRRYCSK